MIRLDRTLDLDAPIADVFAYVADFTYLAEWDPGTVSSKLVSLGEVGEGSKFAVMVKAAIGTSEMTYRVVEWDPPHCVELRGSAAAMDAIDRISFTALSDTQTRVRYEAEFTLNTGLKWSERLLRRTFQRVGDEAMDGLAKAKIPTGEGA